MNTRVLKFFVVLAMALMSSGCFAIGLKSEEPVPLLNGNGEPVFDSSGNPIIIGVRKIRKSTQAIQVEGFLALKEEESSNVPLLEEIASLRAEIQGLKSSQMDIEDLAGLAPEAQVLFLAQRSAEGGGQSMGRALERMAESLDAKCQTIECEYRNVMQVQEEGRTRRFEAVASMATGPINILTDRVVNGKRGSSGGLGGGININAGHSIRGVKSGGGGAGGGTGGSGDAGPGAPGVGDEELLAGGAGGAGGTGGATGSGGAGVGSVSNAGDIIINVAGERSNIVSAHGSSSIVEPNLTYAGMQGTNQARDQAVTSPIQGDGGTFGAGRGGDRTGGFNVGQGGLF